MLKDLSLETQLDRYQQLYSEHHTYRREDQWKLVEPLHQLNNDVQTSLSRDEDNYKHACGTYHQGSDTTAHILIEDGKNSVERFRNVYYQRKDLAQKIHELLLETRLEAASLEIRTHSNGSIAVAYNPITGHAEWKQIFNDGCHGVFNPIAGTIEWQQVHRAGVYGVYNPQLEIIEWKQEVNSGVHGVYNPSTGIVEWKIVANAGVGGVYNPVTKQVEWKECMHGGVVGYFDYEKQSVQWETKEHHGIALIIQDPLTNTYITTSSYVWYDKEL